jgi:dihydropteroate synthase
MPVREWKLAQCSLPYGDRTLLMGVLNVTPDSFSDGGKFFSLDHAVAHAEQMIAEGADLIDVGGESTRPGSQAVSEQEETKRVVPVVEALARTVRIPISIDSYRAAVARRAIDAGAQIVNDISGLRFDDGMPEIVRTARAGVILMHSRGSRETLHKQPRMDDPIQEVEAGLTACVVRARTGGVSNEAIVIDPGIGFGKVAGESLQILRNLNLFSKLCYPILIGTSRKSFIRKISPDEVDGPDWGTVATTVVAILNGAHIVRVHDVRATRMIADVTDRIGGAR